MGGVEDQGGILTHTGDGFSLVAGVPDVPLLNWIHGFSGSDIFVVGNGGTVLHFDGAAWTLQPTPTIEALWGVWGASPDDVWAVGGRGNTSSVATLLHYDGDTWESVTLPEFQRPNVTALFKIWGTAADNIYAIGRSGVILHYQGESWVEEASGTGDDLIALYGTSASEIVAVGGRSNGRVVIWNGETWRAESLAPLPGLNGVFMRTPGRGPRGGRRGHHRALGPRGGHVPGRGPRHRARLPRHLRRLDGSAHGGRRQFHRRTGRRAGHRLRAQPRGGRVILAPRRGLLASVVAALAAAVGCSSEPLPVAPGIFAPPRRHHAACHRRPARGVRAGT